MTKLPLLALAPLACIALGFRRKQASALRQGLLRIAVPVTFLALGCALSGCGDKYPSHTEPGNYTVQLTATSVAGATPIRMTRAITFTLNVTP